MRVLIDRLPTSNGHVMTRVLIEVPNHNLFELAWAVNRRSGFKVQILMSSIVGDPVQFYTIYKFVDNGLSKVAIAKARVVPDDDAVMYDLDSHRAMMKRERRVEWTA